MATRELAQRIVGLWLFEEEGWGLRAERVPGGADTILWLVEACDQGLTHLVSMIQVLRIGPDEHVTVERRGPDEWAVCRDHQVLNSSAEWEYEPSPSNRGDDFIARTRFDFQRAVAAAQEVSLALHRESEARVQAWREANSEGMTDGD